MSLDGQAPLLLASRQFGQGPRPALALHCTMAHSGAWRGVAEVLKDEVTLTAVDLPGHGNSPDWDGQGDTAQVALDGVLPFVTAPVDVIGHSFGAVIAIKIAIARPDLVRSLSLYEPVLSCIATQDAPDAARESAVKMAELIDLVKEGDHAMAARLFLRDWGDGRRWDDLPEELRARATHLIPFVAASEPAITYDNAGILQRLSQISVPTVVMDGATSPNVMKIIQDGLCRRLGNATRATIAGAGHMGPITHSRAVAAEIRKTIARASE